MDHPVDNYVDRSRVTGVQARSDSLPAIHEAAEDKINIQIKQLLVIAFADMLLILHHFPLTHDRIVNNLLLSVTS